MTFYYLNSIAQKNGEHEVHQLSCLQLPEASNRILLGKFSTCDEAIAIAREKYKPSKITVCKVCGEECYTI